MSEKISNIILEIEAKVNLIKLNLNSELAKNEDLTLEHKKNEEKINDLTNQISHLTVKIESLQDDINKLKMENESLNSKANSQIVVEKNKDVEIDFLVREIDQCINQIRNNL
jgi:predicted RNase H-like nuclease (RuvC/YqgF family)